MMFLQNLGDTLSTSLLAVWYGVVEFVPTLLVAVIVFAIGWVLAALIEKLVEEIFKALRIDSALKAAGLDEVMQRAGHKLNSGVFVGSLVKWFVIVVFLVVSFDILHLNEVNMFLREVVLSYLPSVIVAVLVLMVSVVIAETVQKFVVASARAAHVKTAPFLGKVAKYAIWVVAILTALHHLGLDGGPLNTIFIGLVAALSLALGLSFGLGCKDAAGDLIAKVSKEVSERD